MLMWIIYFFTDLQILILFKKLMIQNESQTRSA